MIAHIPALLWGREEGWMERNRQRGPGKVSCPSGGNVVVAAQLSMEQHLRDMGSQVLSVLLTVQAIIFRTN